MEIGDEVIFIGKDYNIAKIFNYEEKFKGKKLIIENIIKCPCDSYYMDKLKFEGIEGFYRASFFTRKDKYENIIRTYE